MALEKILWEPLNWQKIKHSFWQCEGTYEHYYHTYSMLEKGHACEKRTTLVYSSHEHKNKADETTPNN